MACTALYNPGQRELSVFIQYHSITVSFCSNDFVPLSVLQVYTKFIYPQSVYICVYLECSSPRAAHCCSFLVHSQLSYNLRKTFPYQPVNANIPNVPTSIPSHWPDLLFTYHLASLKWFIHLELPKVRIPLNTCFQTGSWYLHGNSRNCLHNQSCQEYYQYKRKKSKWKESTTWRRI